MRVKATRMGYYKHKRRKEGVEFDLVPVKGLDKDGKPTTISAEQQFSKQWMEKIDDEPAAKTKKKSQPVEDVEMDEAI